MKNQKKFISGKATRKVPTAPPQAPPPLPPSKGHLVFGSARWFVLFLVGFVGLIASIYQLTGGPPWPTPPDIEAQNSSTSSPDILPFVITNRSGLFPIKSASLACYVDLAFVMDAERQTILARDMIYSQGAVPVGDGVNYYCDARFLSVGADGSLTIGFARNGQFLRTKPGIFRAPLTTIKLCVAVLGNYANIFGSHKFQSVMFQWPDSPGGNHWIRGPIAFDDDQSRWLPSNSKIGAVYALRWIMVQNSDGSRSYAPGALKCDAPAS